jgi:hypothetical protein
MGIDVAENIVDGDGASAERFVRNRGEQGHQIVRLE